MDSLTFVGTATTVLRLGGFTILTDPNFLHRGSAPTSARACGRGGSPSPRCSRRAPAAGPGPALAPARRPLRPGRPPRAGPRGAAGDDRAGREPAAAVRVPHARAAHVGAPRHDQGRRDADRRVGPGHPRARADGRAAPAGHGLGRRAPRRRRGHAPASTSAATPSPARTWTRSAAGTPTSTSRWCTSGAPGCCSTPSRWTPGRAWTSCAACGRPGGAGALRRLPGLPLAAAGLPHRAVGPLRVRTPLRTPGSTVRRVRRARHDLGVAGRVPPGRGQPGRTTVRCAASTRRVQPRRSRCSSSGTATRRVVPSACRASLRVNG